MGRVCLYICSCLLPIVLIGNAGAQENIRYRWEMETRINVLFLDAMGLGALLKNMNDK